MYHFNGAHLLLIILTEDDEVFTLLRGVFLNKVLLAANTVAYCNWVMVL